MYIHNYELIPSYILFEMEEYAKKGKPPSRFLRCLFANDLFGVVGKADDYNIKIIPTYVSWVYNKAPIGCHGSYEAIEQWIKERSREAYNEKSQSN